MRRLSLVFVAVLLSGCGGTARQPVAGADAARAPDLIKTFGCGGCHTIPGIDGADGRVGPDLGGLADRRFLAGVLPNTPDNLVRWLMDPQAISPNTLMPNLGVGKSQAEDIAAYLYDH